MNVFGIILFAIFAAVAISLFVIGTKICVDAVKESKILKVDYHVAVKKMTFFALGFGAAFAAVLCSIYLWANISPKPGEWVATILGGIVSGTLMCLCLNWFYLHYYGKDIEEKLNKWLFRALAIAFPILIVVVMYTTNGFADYVKYPLVNAFSFNSWSFSRPGDVSTGGITFYALCILSGAIYVYFLCDHNFYKEYGKHGILESTFLVAFPAGIIGARLFYVIGQWETEFGWDAMSSMTLFGHEIPVWAPLAFWDGGLTILGGALMGVVIGVAWFMWRNKGYSIWVAVDLIVPTILIAQAVGRWGNFFNTEVHGIVTSVNNWSFLPKFIINNAQYGRGSGTFAGEGLMYVPLFLVEGITNFLGYFVLAHLFGKRFRKYTELGDLAFGYFIWYGLTRAILEPMRHADFIMNDLWSWFWGLSFVAIGALCIIGNHFIRHLIDVKKGNYVVRENQEKKSIIGIASAVFAAAIIAVVGVLFMINSNYKLEIRLTNFNIAVLLYVIAGSVLFFASIPALHLVEAIKHRKSA